MPPQSISPYARPGPYVTQLSPQEEASFQSWVKQQRIPWQDSPTADYDMRGFWHGNQNFVYSPGQHFPDTWKTPYHRTFSNESMYAEPNAPHWVGNKLVDEKGVVVYDESKPNKR